MHAIPFLARFERAYTVEQYHELVGFQNQRAVPYLSFREVFFVVSTWKQEQKFVERARNSWLKDIYNVAFIGDEVLEGFAPHLQDAFTPEDYPTIFEGKVVLWARNAELPEGIRWVVFLPTLDAFLHLGHLYYFLQSHVPVKRDRAELVGRVGWPPVPPEAEGGPSSNEEEAGGEERNKEQAAPETEGTKIVDESSPGAKDTDASPAQSDADSSSPRDTAKDADSSPPADSSPEQKDENIRGPESDTDYVVPERKHVINNQWELGQLVDRMQRAMRGDGNELRWNVPTSWGGMFQRVRAAWLATQPCG